LPDGLRVIATLAVLGAASLVPPWSLLHDYQRKRVLTLPTPQDRSGRATTPSSPPSRSSGCVRQGWLQGT
jgi:rod shape determining protein RodA